MCCGLWAVCVVCLLYVFVCMVVCMDSLYTNSAHCYQSSYSGTPVDEKKLHGLDDVAQSVDM